ncbi:MAG: RNA polymerase sigma factor [Pseudomonadota bacterium]
MDGTHPAAPAAPDTELIARACAGDRAAFEALLRRHYDLMFKVAYKWTGDRGEAEDVAQEVCIKVGETLSKYRGEAAFSTWLYRVTLNTVRDQQRGRARRDKLAGDVASVLPTHEAPAVETKLATADLWGAVRQLPDRQRDAVLLVYSEGLSHREAAGILGCSEKTVSWHLHEARGALRQHLDPKPEPVAEDAP